MATAYQMPKSWDQIFATVTLSLTGIAASLLMWMQLYDACRRSESHKYPLPRNRCRLKLACTPRNRGDLVFAFRVDIKRTRNHRIAVADFSDTYKPLAAPSIIHTESVRPCYIAPASCTECHPGHATAVRLAALLPSAQLIRLGLHAWTTCTCMSLRGQLDSCWHLQGSGPAETPNRAFRAVASSVQLQTRKLAFSVGARYGTRVHHS